MNIEELKMILETINTTTGLAKDMGTTWIWLHYGFKLLDGLALLVGIAVVTYGIYRIAKTINGSDIDTMFMRSCRDKLKTGTGGCMTDGEYYRTTTKIMELIEQHLKEKT
jgi:hypothetical protein